VDDARTYPVIMTLQRAYAAPELLSLCSKVMLEMRKQNRYEEMVLFYAQARLEFGAGARELTPLAIAALENVTSSEQRSQLLATLWFTVHGKLVERDLTRDAQQWQLEYGDVELALNHWDKARERYQALCNGDETEMELRARAALRLAVLQHARPGTRSVAELLLPVLAIAGMPDEYEIAARLIGFPERLRLEDLDAQLKEARAPLRLTDAEWDLMRGVRLRLDGRMTEAREALAAAAVKADPSRAWVSSVASQLLRNNTRSPDEDKVDAERPAPTPPAPSANFPRVTPGPASMERK
jgi:hypothetical protein